MSPAYLAVCLTLASALTACAHPFEYAVSPVSAESIDGKLDGQWFDRTVTDAEGHVAYVELVYCPTLPSVPTVCRTAVIWEAGRSTLVESSSGGVPNPASVPAATGGAGPT